jgi:hypothetical protein
MTKASVRHTIDNGRSSILYYDDTYTGCRYTYASIYRPFSELWFTDRWIIWSDRPHPDYRFGTMDTTEPIPAEKVDRWELVDLTP